MRANLKSISHRCHLFEVALVWELTKETIHLPLGCLRGGLMPGALARRRSMLSRATREREGEIERERATKRERARECVREREREIEREIE